MSGLARKRLQSTGRLALAIGLVAAFGLGAVPTAAEAHGPGAQVASSYQGRVDRAPGGLRAQVVDGDQRMWLSVSAGRTAVVLDYRGAPYLRFSRSGVAVNRRAGHFSFLAISFLAIWEGGVLAPALWNGFVLAAVPAFVARATAVVCLGCGVGLLVLGFWLADRPAAREGEETTRPHERAVVP